MLLYIRTVRWLDRCLSAHKRDDEQSVFPIVQGGLNESLRKKCAEELLKRNVRGYAVGGLRLVDNNSTNCIILISKSKHFLLCFYSGGERKDDFCRIVDFCTNLLPEDKPRYLMGVGFAEDLVVCAALGIDMFDCVFPTRTARFGVALRRNGQLKLHQAKFKTDLKPIDENCDCSTCKHYTRAYLSHIVRIEAVGASLLTIHNVAFQV